MKSGLAGVGSYDRKWVLKSVAWDLVNPISGVCWKCLDNELSGRYRIAEQGSFTAITETRNQCGTDGFKGIKYFSSYR